MKNIISSAVILIILLFSSACVQEKFEADLVILNGNVITIDSLQNISSALAVKSDTICAVGTVDAVSKLVGTNTKVITLNGETVIPGFIESHAHFMGLGKARMNLGLNAAENWNGVIAEVVEKASTTNPGEWIIGRGWHQEKWDPAPYPNVEGYPIHTMLSKAVPYHPVILTHASGHAIIANAKAMELAGISDSTKDPVGGRILRDNSGEAIGVFEENAEALIYDKYLEHLADKSEEELKLLKEKQLMLAAEECLKKGITSFHDAGETFETVDFIKEIADSGKLDLRLYIMIGDSLKKLETRLPDYKLIGYADNHLTVRSIKTYIDGALGSRSAWMLEPYEDLPGHSGLKVTPLNELERIAALALENDFQLCTHAIGDRGNREILDIYENTLNKNSLSKELRWRIEHAQHLSNKDIKRFAELGVIAAMQGIHCTSDAPYVVQRLGMERAREGAYVWRKLIDSGALICNGTDAPVEDVDPIKSFYSSVTRKSENGRSFFPEQKMTRLEALKSYTINGAFAAFEEDIKGSIEKGKLADITILSQDLLTVPDEEILNTNVVMTIVGGKIKFDNIK